MKQVGMDALSKNQSGKDVKEEDMGQEGDFGSNDRNFVKNRCGISDDRHNVSNNESNEPIRKSIFVRNNNKGATLLKIFLDAP